MRKPFFNTLESEFKNNNQIFLILADLGLKCVPNLNNIDSQRIINVGVAEANMIGIAAGLSMSGKNVYCYSIIPFLTMRACEQIRVDICYNNLNVKLLGAGGGLVYGAEGATHHAIEDISIMRALPNMTIVAPGDAREAEALARVSVSHQGPLYIRFGRDSDPIVHQGDFEFKIGRGITIKEGKDVCLIVTGTMLFPAKIVSDILQKQGIDATLISMHTIKPLDIELLRSCAKKYQAIFTIEEHNIIGGLGSAVAETLVEEKYGKIFKRIGIADKYSSEIGGVDYIREKLGLSSENIANSILKEINKL